MRTVPVLLLVFAFAAACSRGSEPASEPSPDESAEAAEPSEESAETPSPEPPPEPEEADPGPPAELEGIAEAQQAEGTNAPSEEATGDSACAGEIIRAVVAQGIEEREPVGAEGPFLANGEPTYVFLEVNNPDGPEKEYTLRWHYSGSDAAPFSQNMTAGVSPSWRTWARHRLREGQTGAWSVEIVNPDGCTARTVSFEAVGPG